MKPPSKIDKITARSFAVILGYARKKEILLGNIIITRTDASHLKRKTVMTSWSYALRILAVVKSLESLGFLDLVIDEPLALTVALAPVRAGHSP